MKLYPDSKVYIVCPGNVNTGGAELCHQLASQLIQFGVDARLFYYETTGNALNKKAPVHETYKKYRVPYTFRLEDRPQNILIAPEAATEYLYYAKKIRRVIWWMAVDNYFVHDIANLKSYLSEPLFSPMKKFFYFAESDNDIEHWVQSEYARQFVKLNGIVDDKISVVGDYLNQAFLSRAAQVDLSAKKNFVAFNPRKGFEVTQQLMRLAPDIEWRPIQNMTPEQVQELLAAAKVYVDFGNHPGKDRIPREAAISGCVVITGRRGSASNDVDINIPAEFKFDEHSTDARNVIGKIREVFENFSAAHEKQAAYRARILDDKNRFVREVAEAFGIKDAEGGALAILHAVDAEGHYFARALIQSGQFKPKFIVDDSAASAKRVSGDFLLREQNRNWLRVDENLIEIITREDAKFLYLEGRIKDFALAEPNDAEFAELKNFYAPAVEDVLIFSRQ